MIKSVYQNVVARGGGSSENNEEKGLSQEPKSIGLSSDEPVEVSFDT